MGIGVGGDAWANANTCGQCLRYQNLTAGESSGWIQHKRFIPLFFFFFLNFFFFPLLLLCRGFSQKRLLGQDGEE